MPNKHAEVCGCGVSLEFSKSRNTMKTISHRTKSSKNNKAEVRMAEKEYHEGEMDRRTRSNDNGSCSAMSEQIKYAKNNTKLERRRLVNSSRRTRSAERPSSHYTYIGIHYFFTHLTYHYSFLIFISYSFKISTILYYSSSILIQYLKIFISRF